MKKIYILLSALIIGSTQLSAMKRDMDSKIIPTNSTDIELWVPDEIITKIAATCHPKTRISLSLVNKLFNKLGSLKNNEQILYEEKFELDKKDRLYYLFYGCIHNIENLIPNALKKFNLEDSWEKEKLANAIFCIEKLTHSNVTHLLTHLPEYILDKNQTTLGWATHQDDELLFKLLLEQPNVDVNEIYSAFSIDRELFFNPLISLVYGLIDTKSPRYRNMLKLLLDHPDTNVNIETNTEYPPLHAAIRDIAPNKIIKLLLTHPHIDVNTQGIEGCTPLHLATEQNWISLVKLLLAHPDININVQDIYGTTPLHFAIGEGNVILVELLLADPRIDLSIKNNNYMTPISLATCIRLNMDYQIKKPHLNDEKNIIEKSKNADSICESLRLALKKRMSLLEKKIVLFNS